MSETLTRIPQPITLLVVGGHGRKVKTTFWDVQGKLRGFAFRLLNETCFAVKIPRKRAEGRTLLDNAKAERLLDQEVAYFTMLGGKP